MVQRNYFSGWTEKGDSEELGGSAGHISLPHEGEKRGRHIPLLSVLSRHM